MNCLLLSENDGDADLVAALSWSAKVKDATANARIKLSHALQGVVHLLLAFILPAVHTRLKELGVSILDLVPEVSGFFPGCGNKFKRRRRRRHETFQNTEENRRNEGHAHAPVAVRWSSLAAP